MIMMVGAGSTLLVCTRIAVKASMMALLPQLLPESSAPPGKRFAVEIPCKVCPWLPWRVERVADAVDATVQVMTYSAVGVAATAIAPLLFMHLKL